MHDGGYGFWPCGNHDVLLSAQMTLGAVNTISSEEEFDLVLEGHQQRLVVLEASLTWCRPCKGFDRAYQKFAGAGSATSTPAPA